MKKAMYRLALIAAVASLFVINVSFASQTDDLIESSAKESYVFKTYLKDSKEQKELTGEYALGIDGVKEVKNEMTVAKTPREQVEKTTGKKLDDASEWVDDASITALVKTSLLYHRSTSGLNTKVETNDGVVTLSGKAKNAAEKDLAAKVASDVHGVKKVVNNMTVE